MGRLRNERTGVVVNVDDETADRLHASGDRWLPLKVDGSATTPKTKTTKGAGGTTPAPEDAYLAKKKPELEADVAARNAGRNEADQVVVAEPGNKPELAAALVADDAKTAAAQQQGGDGQGDDGNPSE